MLPAQPGSALLQQISFYDSGLGGLTSLPGAVYLDASLSRPAPDGAPRSSGLPTKTVSACGTTAAACVLDRRPHLHRMQPLTHVKSTADCMRFLSEDSGAVMPALCEPDSTQRSLPGHFSGAAAWQSAQAQGVICSAGVRLACVGACWRSCCLPCVDSPHRLNSASRTELTVLRALRFSTHGLGN